MAGCCALALLHGAWTFLFSGGAGWEAPHGIVFSCLVNFPTMYEVPPCLLPYPMHLAKRTL